jgi:hypothetical protein
MNNKIIVMLGALLGLSMLSILFGTNASADNESIPSVDQALKAIRDADAAGADVSVEIVRFNAAMELLHQASTSDFSSCSSHDSCVDAANIIFASITDDATTLREQAVMKSYEEIILSEIIIIAGAFLSSVFALLIYRHWKLSQQERILNKDIVGNA